MSVETIGDLGFSYEYAVEVDVSATETPEWKRCRFISAVNPQATPITEDAATYDDLGAPNAPRVSESWTLDFFLQQRRVASTGAYLPEVAALMAAQRPDVVGDAGAVKVRWFDSPIAGKGSEDEAYSGVGTVAVTRANTANSGVAGWNFTITGKGRRTAIPNPANVEIP